MNLKDWLKANYFTYRSAGEILKISAGSLEKIANGKTWASRGTARRIIEMTDNEVDLYELYQIERERKGHHG